MKANPPEAKFQMTISKLRKRSKISSLLVYVLHKCEIRHFYVLVVLKRERNVQKRVVHVVVVLLIKPIVFWPSRCRPRRWILKSLMSRWHLIFATLETNASRNCFWDRYWGLARQLLANFSLPLVTIAETFAKVNSSQFSRFLSDAYMLKWNYVSVCRVQMRCLSTFSPSRQTPVITPYLKAPRMEFRCSIFHPTLITL